MENTFAFLLIVISSLGTYIISRKMRAAPGRSIRRIVQVLLECIGASAVFLVSNVLLGVVIIFVIRRFTSVFLPLYQLQDLTLLALSAMQGFVFQLWWRGI